MNTLIKSNPTLKQLGAGIRRDFISRCTNRAGAITVLLGRHLTKNDVPVAPPGPKINSRWLSYEAIQRNGLDDDDDNDEILCEVEEANMRCKGLLEVRKTEGQWGVHTSRPYNKGDIVLASNLKYSDTKPTLIPCAHSIQIGWGKHILMNLPARYINHSCDPNVGVGGLNEFGSYDFLALEDIESDEELKFDYETTEYEIGAFSECLCGSHNCRGSIHGYKYTGDVIQEKYGGKNVASYLLTDAASKWE